MAIGVTMTRASAAGAFSFTSNVAADDTVTIGGVTYTFAADPSGTANDVDVGTDLDDSISNLVAAINASGTDDDEYGAGTVAHPAVTASADLANDEIDLTARVPGEEADGIYLAATSPGGNSITAGSTTLGGVSGAVAGAGNFDDWLESLENLNQINSQILMEMHALTDATD